MLWTEENKITGLSTQRDMNYREAMEAHLRTLAIDGGASLFDVVNTFANYVRRQELTRFCVRYELFKQVLHVKGSIVECGVLAGQGLMSWAQLSAILEPVAFWRHIFGFDTFEGFPHTSGNDLSIWKEGDLRSDSYTNLLRCVELFDMNRFLNQIPKVSLVKGDFVKAGPEWLAANPHVLVALLYMDFDLYEPTKKALEMFLPRMPKGAILGFDQINNPAWPGETTAMLESLNVRDYEIRQFPFEPNMAYVIL